MSDLAKEGPRELPHLRAHYPNREALLDAIDQDGDAFNFFVAWKDGTRPPQWARVGDAISISLIVEEDGAAFHVHARVKKRIVAGRPAGLWLRILEEERSRQELVLAFAKGNSVPYFRRRHPRLVCDLPARISHRGRRRRKTRALDIGEGGVRLALFGAETELKQLVEVELRFSGGRQSVAGRVVSVVDKGPQAGMGIEFLFESARAKAALKDAVTTLYPAGQDLSLL